MVDISLILSAISIPIAFFSLYLSGITQTRSNRLNAFDFFLGQLGGKEARAHRGIIRNSPIMRGLLGIQSPGEFKNWEDQNNGHLKEKNPETGETLESVARDLVVTYDRVGFILSHYPSMEVEILEWNGSTIDDMWRILEPLIKYKWRIPPFDRHYASNFEQLGEKAAEYLKDPNQYIKKQHLITRFEVWFGNVGIYHARKKES